MDSSAQWEVLIEKIENSSQASDAVKWSRWVQFMHFILFHNIK
jgi:hypothetical protein